MRGHPPAAPNAAGAHFLRDQRLISRLVCASGAGDGDLVLDLGAGYGSITAALAAAGARVTAVERDPRLVRRLQRRFVGDRRVRVVAADVLRMPLPRHAFLVVSNIPFGVTTRLLRRLLGDPAVPLAGAQLIVAHGAACWLASARPRDAETAWWASRYEMRLVRTIPAGSFAPPPSVDAAQLSIQPRDGTGPATGQAAGSAAGSARGQRALRTLQREAFRDKRRPVGVNRRLLVRAGIAPGTPAAELTGAEWHQLARVLTARSPVSGTARGGS